MAGEQNTNYKVETIFTDWKPFIDNTQNELNDIEKIGANAYLDYELINIFYARLKAYMTPRWSYVLTEDKKILKDKLKKIGKTLFSTKYLQELRKSKLNNYNNTQFIQRQAEILDDLFLILETACEGFKKYKLLYYGEEIEVEDIEDKYKGAAV